MGSRGIPKTAVLDCRSEGWKEIPQRPEESEKDRLLRMGFRGPDWIGGEVERDPSETKKESEKDRLVRRGF